MIGEVRLIFKLLIRPFLLTNGCLKKLLNRNYRMRLGSKESGGFVNFQKHKFFEGIDWILLNKKGIEAPFVPDVSG
jgi:hypothetical protein